MSLSIVPGMPITEIPLLAGHTEFPPLVCINRMVIDGQHRFWACQQLGYQTIKIYQNVPWAMPAAA